MGGNVRVYVLVDDYSPLGNLYSTHGASYLVEADNTRILFDTGPQADVLLHNMAELRLDPRDVDYIVLSHCHYDHTGGLLGLLKAASRRLPVIAHSALFRTSLALKPRLRYIGIPFSRSELESLAHLILTVDPVRITENVLTTGEIRDREEFEKRRLEFYTITDGKLVRDEMRDDLGLLIETRRGLVILAGCAHAGIVSTVKHAIRLTGRRVEAVIGGFHLRSVEPEWIERTVEELEAMGVEEVYTGHCTGLRAEARFMEVFGERFHKLYAGMVIELPS